MLTYIWQAWQMGQKAVCLSQRHFIVFGHMQQRLVDDETKAREVRRHASCGRAEALVLLYEDLRY